MPKIFRNPFKSKSKSSGDSTPNHGHRQTQRVDTLSQQEILSLPSRQSTLVQSTTVASESKPLESTSSHEYVPYRAESGTASGSDAGSVGLSVIYSPDHGHKADIVFVHGLGGTSRHTWSKHKNPELFWPLTFLPLEPDICLARILTFGYNANFRKAGNISRSILDFAKDLLFDMRFSEDGQKNDLRMGDVPLIFVVHSMGGLIVKEAYIQGQNDPDYQAIIKSISAITFLATPHRGTNLAEILNKILQSTFVNNSKQYISELSNNSFMLQKLNEQFRHIAPKLDIVSFYETQSTSIGVKNLRVMVLEKESSVLGYPGETSKALDADHHGICKYESPRDPNYVTVRNVLKSLISKILSSNRSKESPLLNRRKSLDVKSYLGVMELPDVDFIFFQDQWAEGTGQWIFEENLFSEWLQAIDSGPHLLWLNGGAGTGKSVLSSFLINTLADKGLNCQYFFIRSGDQKKKTLSLLLRTIAYQIAQAFPVFSDKVLQLVDHAIDFSTADPNTIWERIFKSLLFKMRDLPPLYWIVDGLDEADSSRAIIRQFSGIKSSYVPIRILLVSRDTLEIATAIQRVSNTLMVGKIRMEGHLEDLRCYIRQELSMPGSIEYRESISNRIVDGSQNIFLWVRFVIDKLNSCHTNEDVELVLHELPSGMEALYDRMAAKIANSLSSRDRKLSFSVLQRVSCSFRLLTVAELSESLPEDTSQILDIQRSIVGLCAGFTVIDNGANVSMIHETAREYLLNAEGVLSIDRAAAHEQMFLSCIRNLMDPSLRTKLRRKQKLVFLDYATNWWSFHLAFTSVESHLVIQELQKFLRGSAVLTWIEILAINKQLRQLVQASKNFLRYCGQLEESRINPLITDLFKSWAMDFVKIVGKFGALLQRDSESIYRMIPPFCPQGSSIFQQFGKSESMSLAVSGLSSVEWDDLLARLSTGIGTYTASISAAGAQIAILTSPGNVFLYDSSTFEESSSSPFKHNEPVYRTALNTSGTLLASYGYRTTKVWHIPTGKCLVSVSNDESRSRPLALLFIDTDATLLIGTDDRRVRSLDISEFTTTWKLIATLDEPELEGHLLNSASHMAFNPDASLISVAYRGHPVAAWDLHGHLHIGHCWKPGREHMSYGEVIDACWHPHYPELWGLYLEGVVFRWRPYEDKVEEFRVTGVSRFELSKDGNLFATGDVHGTVKVYTTSHFKLIYQLASQDPVLGLTFSPDSRRIYDIRGYYGNSWEPNVLMRYAEQVHKGADSDSETDSLQLFTASANACHWIDSVTALATSPTGRRYCFGTEKGMIELHDIHLGKLRNYQASKSYLSIEAMCWSSDGKYLAFSDSSKTVFVVSLPSSEDRDVSLEPSIQLAMASTTAGHICQLLFKETSDLLLVYTDCRAYIICISSRDIIHSFVPETSGCRWIIHPHDPNLVIGFGPGIVHVLDWNLDVIHIIAFNNLRPSNEGFAQGANSSPTGRFVIDRVLVTQDKKHIMCQQSAAEKNSRERSFLAFPTSAFPTSFNSATQQQERAPAFVSALELPGELVLDTSIILCFLTKDRLIVLSKSFSVRSVHISFDFDIPSSGNADNSGSIVFAEEEPKTSGCPKMKALVVKNVAELFSFPGDWISRECLASCSVWLEEKSLLCPRNGEVAVVKCSALN
ncbi:NACHT and WD domain protein [Colletotrichum lupini]|nr:NACHT and WD domain protein [Colletotrichum lupini]